MEPMKLSEEDDANAKSSAATSASSNSKTFDVSDNIPPTSMTFSSAVTDLPELNHDVLRHIYSFLDLDSLKNCRLVSKTWNEEASVQLGETSWFKVNWQKIYLVSDYNNNPFTPAEKKEAGLTNNQRDEKGKEEIEKLFECLSSLYDPSVFSNFEFDFEWLTNEKFQKLLDKFGSCLKRITIRDRKEFRYGTFDENYFERMDIVPKILTKWCPHLSTFEMEVVRKPKELKLTLWKKASVISPNMKWMDNIRELKMEGVLTQHRSEFWIQLIKACPSLTALSIWCLPERKTETLKPEETQICDTFFKQLSELPEVAKKLNKFSWNGTWRRFQYVEIITSWDKFAITQETSCSILQIVSKMEFSNKLKTIEIGPSIDSMNRKERYLTQLLEKLNVCGTEEIVFNGKYWKPLTPEQIRSLNDSLDDSDEYSNDGSYSGTDDDERDPCGCDEDDHTLECGWKIRINHIPQMTKVKSIKSFGDTNYELSAFHFLHKFPNLKKYEMSPDLNNEKDYPQADDFAQELKYLCKFPHLNLRKLVVNPPVKKPNTLDCIIKSFPNLTSLHFQVGTLLVSDCIQSGSGFMFHTALSFVSKMENLKELTVSLLTQYSPADLCKALGVVKKFPKLEHLTLIGVICKPKVSFENIKDGLRQLSDLATSVSLAGLEMTKDETIEIENYCEQNHIRAKFVPDVGDIFPRRRLSVSS